MTFAPPDNLSAGEVGVLVDERVQMRDITAVIIDLASRGFITVKDVEVKKFLLKKNTVELINNTKDEKELLKFEKLVMDMLFSPERSEKASLDKLHPKAYIYLDQANTELYNHMAEKGYFVKNPRSVRTGYLVGGIVLMFVGSFLMTFIGEVIAVGGGIFAAIVSGLIIIAFSPFMPAKTPKGRKALKEVVGLKEWIRIGAWRERVHEKNNFIEEVLPYTIAFGLTHKFIKALKDADLKNLDWYQSDQTLNAVRFANLMNSFNTSVSHAVASTRPKTSSPSSGGSGFSGGGSGGGFGGGGGGSW
jgi:uncharacterized membrane protein